MLASCQTRNNAKPLSRASSTDLKPEDCVLVLAGETIPADEM